MVEDEGHRRTREHMARAIRRLHVLEYVILAAILGLSLLGGALAGWLLHESLGFPFRLSWAVASILLFAIPAAAVLGKEAQGRRPGNPPPGSPSDDQVNEDATANE